MSLHWSYFHSIYQDTKLLALLSTLLKFVHYTFFAEENYFGQLLDNVHFFFKSNNFNFHLGSVAGPVIQANGRLTFEDDLRSGGLLGFTTQ